MESNQFIHYQLPTPTLRYRGRFQRHAHVYGGPER